MRLNNCIFLRKEIGARRIFSRRKKIGFAITLFDFPIFPALAVGFQMQTPPARFASTWTITAQMIHCQTKRAARQILVGWTSGLTSLPRPRAHLLLFLSNVLTGLGGVDTAMKAQQLSI
jgi:hypothetical protein